ncbi:MAG: ATP-binding cassette domain-containing protein [Desulfobacteraceae bacterium]|nr:ATP-binding cassette domain-containing protein [Desulfobacteraceae bacterium]
MTEPFIQFVDVKKSFDEKQVLKGVNLSIYKGEIIAIIGKSGCGKSVLLKHIIGLMSQDSGKILISGKDLSQLNKKEKKIFKNKLSYMFQGNALFDSLNIFDNIALPLVENFSFSKDKIKEKVKLRMSQLEIEGTEEEFPSRVSGGMQKRVALARALVIDPDIVLFDEPTTGLDPVRKTNVHIMIKEYQAKFGFTAIIVSHEIPEIFFIAQRIAMLDSGRILFEGSQEMLLESDDVTVKSFIAGNE